MHSYPAYKLLSALLLAAGLAGPVRAGLITIDVVEDKGSVTIQPGNFEKTFTSHMSVALGTEWGDLAGNFERVNKEKLVWVNNGPAVTRFFANVYPKEIHVPQNPAPNPYAPASFFDVFVELGISGNLAPLAPGMQIEPSPAPLLEGASGNWYPGTVTPISDLSQLPVSSSYDTEIVWDLSRFTATTGNFYLIQYDLPNAFELTRIPEPSTPVLLATALAAAFRFRRRPTLPAPFPPPA